MARGRVNLLVRRHEVIQDPADAVYFTISDRHGRKGFPCILLRCLGVSARRPVYDVGHYFPPGLSRARQGASPSSTHTQTRQSPNFP